MASSNTSIDLSSIFAPVFWGFVISLLFGGMTIVQAYNYFSKYPNDRFRVRFAAASMLVLDLLSSALVAYSVYYYLVPQFGDLLPLSTATSEMSIECLISTGITLTSQLYFAHQLISVKRSGRGNWVIIGIIVVLAILGFAGGIGCTVAMLVFRHNVLVDRNRTFEVFFGVAKALGAITDILATGALCAFLTSAKTGMRQTNRLIDSLMKFIVHRGALVASMQTLLLISFYAFPTRLHWLAFHFNVTKLYVNTFFAMLNAREGLKEKHLSRTANSALFSDDTTVSKDRYRTKLANINDPEQHLVHNVGSFSSQEDREKPLEMPTVTKTVVVANL